MTRLLNTYEEVTYDKLKPVCEENDAHVFAKVRIADALPVNGSGIPDTEFSFALKAHFDFIATDEHYRPIFAVEYDGPMHADKEQRRRDAKKNWLCEHFSLPLLRANANHLNRKFRGFDLLTYFVDVWFLDRAFEDARQRGEIPWDEGFDPMWVISNGKSDRSWPYWLSIDIQCAVRHLYEEGEVSSDIICHWVGTDKEDNYRCLCWLRMPEDRFVVAETGMRSQSFPIYQPELVWQLGAFDVHDRLADILKGTRAPTPEDELMQKYRYYQATYEQRAFGGYADHL